MSGHNGAMYLREADLNHKFNHYLLKGNIDFIFNGDTKEGLKKFIELSKENKHTVKQKYKEPVIVPNTNNWYIDMDAINRLNINLLGEK